MSKKTNKQKQKLSKDRIIKTADGPMSVRLISVGKAAPMSSNTESNIVDPFVGDYSGVEVLAPPYPLLKLAQILEYSPPLAQCISVMTTNVVGFGYELVRARYYKSEDEMPPEAKAEKEMLMQFFQFVNRKESFTKLMRRLWKDYETAGMAYMEVVRNAGGKIAGLHRLPAHSVRWTKKDKESTDFIQRVRGPSGKYIEIPRRDKFRRYVQRLDGMKKMYFKEYGDPRLISSATGKEAETSSVPANEVIIFEQEAIYTTYPLPRWVANMMGIFGAHDADTVNYLFFQNKTIPPLIVTVSGGSLTEETVEKLTDQFAKEIKGVQNFHNALILEASPAQIGSFAGEKVSPVKIEVKPLTAAITDDGQFLKYRDAVAKSIRSDYRIPPILLGLSDEYTHATVVEAVRTAEEQVFEPERQPIEAIIANTIMADMDAQHWTLEFLGGKTSDYSEMLKAIGPVKEMVPIGQVQKIVNKMINEPAEDIPEELFQTLLGELNAAINEAKISPDDSPPKNPIKQINIVEKLEQVRSAVLKGLAAKKAVA